MHRSFLKRFPLFIWLLFAVSSVSNFRPDTGGGGDLSFRFASSFPSCRGEGAALQTDIAVCGEHSPCSGHTGFAPLTGVCAFPVYTAQAPSCSIWSRPCVECVQFSGTPQKHRFGCACVLCLPRSDRLWQPGAWAHSPWVWRAFSLGGPSSRRSGACGLPGPSQRQMSTI